MMMEEQKNESTSRQQFDHPERADVQEMSAEEEEPMETMEDILEQYEVGEMRRGKVVDGTIVEAADEGWLVDVGYKCEGFLPRREWSHRVLVEKKETPEVGDSVRVQVVSFKQGEEAQLLVSRWRCEFDERWGEIEEKADENDILSVRGLRKVKGGLIVDCHGIEGFIPISHLAEEGRGINPSRLVGETFDAKIIERDRRKRRLVLSRRSILEEELARERQAFYESTSEGDVLEGTVTTITSFGVFVNLGPIEGLVHNSELSWQRNAKPREIVSRGDKVAVKVIGIDRERDRISLSMKQLQPDPWENILEKCNEGDVVSGRVTNLTDFGAFVEVEPGVEGLVHIGDISWQRIRHPRDVLRKGQQIEVKILGIDAENKRMSLGYKQLNDPWEGVEDKYTVKQDYPVKVVRLTDFGAFVQLEEGIEGLIHVSQLSRKRVEKPADVLEEGQEIEARVLEIKPEERRIRLSISAIEEEEHRRTRSAEKSRRKNEPEKQRVQFTDDDQAAVTIGDLWNEAISNRDE